MLSVSPPAGLKKSLLLLFPLMLLLCRCGTTQYTPQTYKGRQISIVQGGGFTNARIEYNIFENGTVFKTETIAPESRTVRLQPLEKKQVKYIFSKIKKLNIQETEFFRPGNLYYYIEYKRKDKSYRVTWGEQDVEPPKGYRELYESAWYMVSSQKPE